MALEQLGPYRIGPLLGRGGMGAVYEGIDVETHAPAAVKVLSPALAEHVDFRERFKVEIETLRKLRHPNIVRIFGFGEQQGHLFYAMERVDGRGLDEILREGKRFTWRDVTRMARSLCGALKHAHDRGVIHRDIKPANLLLTASGDIKLTDFGIAKLFGMTGLTAVGGVVGTAEYMAPEQCDGRRVTERSDLYSLGGVLYTLLARRPPFLAETIPEMLQLQRFAVPEPVRAFAADVPEALEHLIQDLLAKDPADRIPNAMMLARRLEAMEHGLSRLAEQLDVATDSPTDTLGNGDVGLTGDKTQSAVAREPGVTKPADSVKPQPLSRSRSTLDETVAAPAIDPGGRASVSEFDISPTLTQDSEPNAADMAADATSMTGFEPSAAGPPSSEKPSVAEDRFTTVKDEEPIPKDESRPLAVLLSLQTWGLIIALAIVGLLGWSFMQPPSPDRLYERIAAQIDRDRPEALLGAEDNLRRFVETFPNDPRCAKVRSLLDEVELAKLERKFQRHVGRMDRVVSLTPVEHAYLEALSYLRLDPELGAARLRAIVDLFGTSSANRGPEKQSGPTQLCVELARRRLAALEARIQRDGEAQQKTLDTQLTRAKQLADVNPDEARTIWRAIIELYGGKSWAQEAVDEASSELKKHSTQTPGP